LPNSYQILDGVKAVSLSSLSPDAWSPADPLDSPSETSARRLHATVPILSRALDVRAKAVATIPLRLERNGKDIADSKEGRAILARLRGLMYRSEVGLCMSAAAYWELATNRAGRNLTPYWCATGTVTETRDPETGEPTFYRAGSRNGRGTMGRMATERVAAIYMPSDNVDVGIDPDVAPVRAVLTSAGLLRGLDQYSITFFARGGVKITLLQVESGLPKPERDKLRDWWDRATRGVRDAFRSLVISNKIEPKVIGSDPKDTAAPELQAAAREDVAVGLGVPMSLLYSSALAGGTADAERLNFYELTVVPEVDLILPVANERWLSRLGLEAIGDYDRLEVRQWAFAKQAEALQKLVGDQPILTVNEARTLLGMLPMAHADEPPEPPPALPDGDEPPPEPPAPTNAPDPEAKAMAQWETKALKRMRGSRSPAVAFVSDALDPDDAALIRERLAHATTPEAVKAAFAIPPPGSDLSPDERALYDALVPIFTRYGRETVRAILAGNSVDDRALAAEILAALSAALAPVVSGQALTLAAGIGPALDEATAAGLGAAYAQQQVAQRVTAITETTRQAIQKAVSVHRETPGMTREQLESVLRPAFGPRRAESIAITEVTNASSAATSATQDWLAERGLVFVRMWRTNNDEKTCPVCGPLNGKPEREWVDRFPDGPAAHPRCRCFVTLAEDEEANQ
jgi:hypothetical protein